MAFVNATPLTSSLSTNQSLRPELSSTPLRPTTNTNKTSSSSVPSMGYGDYSYLTDKTKGHVNQYYIDKFRTKYDYTRGLAASDADAMIGRTAKGGVFVPKKGIPQLDSSYTSLIPIIPDVAPDPRISESEGRVYPWDPNYEDPMYAGSTYEDVNSEEVAEDAFAKFLGSVSEERGKALTAMDFGAYERIKRLTSPEGLNERYILSFEGQLDAAYVRAQKLASPALLNPTGIPQTEIPGTNYLPAVGALDFIEQEEKKLGFWKSGSSDSAANYRKPAGNEMPEVSYNISASPSVMKALQEARNIIPKDN